MSIQLTRLIPIVAAGTAASLCLASGRAIAQTASPQTPEAEPPQEVLVIENIPEFVNEAFNAESNNFYDNDTVERQAQTIFGLPYPETAITNDAELLNAIYNELQQQQSAQPLLTRDLDNPFDTSLRTGASELITPLIEQPGPEFDQSF